MNKLSNENVLFVKHQVFDGQVKTKNAFPQKNVCHNLFNQVRFGLKILTRRENNKRLFFFNFGNLKIMVGDIFFARESFFYRS